ncbi:MAG: hypothetical protein ACFCUU_06555, partial [Cyclobacteriaceae bacterium]
MGKTSTSLLFSASLVILILLAPVGISAPHLPAKKLGYLNASVENNIQDECKKIARTNNRKFKRNIGNLSIAKEIVSSGMASGCMEYEAFFQAAELVHAHDPDFKIAYTLGQLYLNMEDEVHAIEFLEDAMELATDENQKNEIRNTLNKLYRSQVNYDEYKVPSYTLPELLKFGDGSVVNDASTWMLNRRPEILGLFSTHMYGKVPEFNTELIFKTTDIDTTALNGKATRKQVSIMFKGDDTGLSIDVLMYIPNNTQGAVPAFVGLNFYGNHTVHSDNEIAIHKNYVLNNAQFGIANNRVDESTRAVRSERWQVEKIIDRGYALVTAYYGDIDPDFHDNFQNGVHALAYKDGKTQTKADEWGSIAAWAWGLSRIMDYLELDRAIDNDKVAVMGHSRLGKAAVWAGANDDRFSMVISNNSGCGGAALSRRKYGETIGVITTSFPHWFCHNLKTFKGNEKKLPVDQHMLLALVAPRPLYVASAEDDRWSDPKGEFLSAAHATEVYALLGYEGLPTESMPAINQSVMGTIGYHIREGKHDVNAFDWEQFLD